MDNLIILDSERRYFPSSNKFIRRGYAYSENIYLKLIYKLFILPKVKQYIQKGNFKIIAIDKETEETLKENRVPYSKLTDYITETDFRSYEAEMLRFIREIPKILPELEVVYKNISLWKFEENNMAEKFFPPIIIGIEVINKIINQEKATRLILFNSSSKNGMVQKAFGKRIKIVDQTDLLSRFRQFIFKKLMFLAVKTIDVGFLKAIYKAEYVPHLTKPVIYFEEERGVKKYQNILEKIKEKTTVLEEEEVGNNHITYLDYDSLSNYLNSNSKKNLVLFEKELKHNIFEIKKSQSIKQRFRYKEITLTNIFSDMLDYLYQNGHLKSAYYIETMNNFILQNQPKLIINSCEGLKKQKIILELSKRKNIKSLLLIHGTLSDRERYDHLVSSKVAVYGKHYKQILHQMKNNPKKIVVTGNPSYDNITRRDLTEKEIRSRINLPEKKIIVLATTPLQFDNSNGVANITFKVMTKIPEYHLVTKLHPEEKPDYYLNQLKKINLKSTICEDIKLLHPLIKISELVIIADSTVGLETVLLHKPLIDVNLTTAPYWNDYVEKCVALGVRKEEDLLPAIKSILEDETVRKKLAKNRKKYIYEHAYKQDGKAGDRVVKLINKMLKEVDRERKFKKNNSIQSSSTSK